MDDSLLTPQQEMIRNELLLVGQQPVAYDRSLAQRLRVDLQAQLASVTQDLPRGQKVWVNKHRLRYVFECEGHLRARDAEGWSGWNLGNVRGRVTHRAMEGLIISGYQRAPLEIAQAAIDYLAKGDDDLGTFLGALDDGQRQDLIRDANNMLVRFSDDWPVIPDAWSPVVESRSRGSFGPVTLDAVFDLALRIPMASDTRTFVVDFKTGKVDTQHQDEARFYALVETLRSRNPPYRIATYYLDEGDYQCEDVDEELLRATLDRVVEGIKKIIVVESGGPVSLDPGTQCRYCSSLPGCDPGNEWMEILGPSRYR